MATTEDFQHDYVQRQSQMDGLVGSHIDSQTKFCDTLRVRILSIRISSIEIFINVLFSLLGFNSLFYHVFL